MTSTTPHPTLAAHTLKEQWERSTGVRLVDVRTPAEFEAAHIAGAYNVPLAQVSEYRDYLSGQLEHGAVLICRSGARARQAADMLAAQGMTGVSVLDGGMVAWENSGAPVNRGRQTWDLERQVRFAAGSLVLAGIVGSTVVPHLKWFSGAIGTGLVVAAVTNTCAMGNALARMPWNQAVDHPGLEDLATDAPTTP